jgi:predicted transcriptional regulator
MTPSKSATQYRSPERSRTAPGSPSAESPEVEPERLLSLLTDEYVHDIVGHIADESLAARTIADRLGVARSTVYRRLDRLEEAGMLETEMVYHPDGHHRREFTVSLDEVVLSFDDGLDVDRVH